MLIGNLCRALFFVGAVSAASCSSDSKPGGGVGAKCTESSQCTGYAKPTCLTDLRPLDGLVAPDSGTAGATFKRLDIPFPGGYCSNTIADSCQTDADCGSGGGCYRPFTGVMPDVLSNLDNAVKVFSVTDFATKGLCLAPCKADSDCRGGEGYKCVVPLHDFISTVNPAYTTTYCIQDIDVKYLLQPAATDGG